MTVCVGAVVLRGDQVLFVRQAAGHPLEGQWSIPWGIVDAHETPEVAVLRETWEESGIRADLVGFLGFQNLPQEGWLGLIFLCRHVGGVPRPDGVETDRVAYLSLEEMVGWAEPFEPWCAWVVRRVLQGKHHIIPPASDTPYHPRLAFL